MLSDIDLRDFFERLKDWADDNREPQSQVFSDATEAGQASAGLDSRSAADAPINALIPPP